MPGRATRDAGLEAEFRKGCRAGRKEGIKIGASPLQRADAGEVAESRRRLSCVGEPMSVVVFAVLTIALFAVLGVIQKAVERL
ncbi:hypothetical protein [Mycolicibacterium sp. CBMA 226]|uniref:hypothetical protein n=1 Tax=Mycolicibacterium sp. CBMA 226 TaxID=2606611 RepID=UPI001FB6DEC3|nr:hypothetical protein [Mycolicibacterium sp. CBMA 226]